MFFSMWFNDCKLLLINDINYHSMVCFFTQIIFFKKKLRVSKIIPIFAAEFKN